MEPQFDSLRLVYLLGVLIIVAPGLVYVLRDKSRALRNTVVWLAIAAAVAVLYRLFGGTFR